MSLHEHLNAVDKSKAVANIREQVGAAISDSDAESHGESWRKAMDETRADRTQRHAAKSHGSKSHAQLQNLNATDAE